LSAGAGTQLEVLNARVEVTRAQSISLQALFSYNSAVAEFDRVTATEVTYANQLDDPRTRQRVRSEARPTRAQADAAAVESGRHARAGWR
ncbi:MAG TPA: hypothetical protein VG095_01630, partial [Chthoniobacterales bacterium]|nr:hypothetical protein [Chthoniobacterales bacterium]